MCTSSASGASFVDALTMTHLQSNEGSYRKQMAASGIPESQTNAFFGDMQSRATAMSPKNAGIFQPQQTRQTPAGSATPTRQAKRGVDK